MKIFTAAWEHIKHLFSAHVQDLVDFFKPAAAAIESAGGEVLRQIAVDAVKAAESAGGTGKDKFNTAWNVVTTELIAKGIPVVENAVRIAIETAVAGLAAGA